MKFVQQFHMWVAKLIIYFFLNYCRMLISYIYLFLFYFLTLNLRVCLDSWKVSKKENNGGKTSLM